MFKTAATKIAHNSTLPALAGNKDLRPLQDLITLEKNVLMSLQKLSVDFTKASEALRAWGIGEGDDLGDILSASTTILAHWSAALAGYATREHTIRDHLKQIRTREEALDELKRRRKATLARADSAEKKLNKMGPEHKNLAQQTDTLNQLQAQIRQMDSEIMTEEAALGDFKRTSARALMGVKFGGLMECCEKGVCRRRGGQGDRGRNLRRTNRPWHVARDSTGMSGTESLGMQSTGRVLAVPLSGSASASGTSQFSLAGGSTFSSLTKQQEREREMEAQRRREREEEPAPEYRDYETYTQTQTGHSQVFEYPGALPPGPPPGAAPAVVGSVWAASSAGDGASYSPGSETRSSGPGSGARIGGGNLAVEEGGGDRQSSASEIGLAYMNMGNDDADDAPIEGEGEKERQARLSKHVRFGKETEFVEPAPEPQYMKRQPSSSSMGATGGRSRRVPPPTFEPEEDERALNAAAAREVSRELDALSFSPPPVAQPSQVQTESEGSWEFATPTQRPPTPPRTSSQTQTPSSPPRKQYSPPQKYSPPAGQPPPAREPSPLIPPAAPFARKATLDNVPTHRSIPSSEAPASSPVQPAPFVPGHHTTPSWAVSPPPDRDAANGSPVSPRLDSPYRAPFANRSTSSLNAQAAQPPPGARTISRGSVPSTAED
ncbi:hypothetical protein MSAN_02472200 [Mycena sanguinolenta]|uniref:Eisosome component PIL1-domain-containing protein n=1 Tax=Mycena sanguinolenta TaxID=230812 RepID=A0A8H6U2E4_9AGAR|nr:hypothetical protein MSAN_02472200 [Mycena sanguinolenta]